MAPADPQFEIPTDPQAPVPIDSPTLTLEPGRVIGGRYEVRGRLGAGGMGLVYRVYDGAMAEEVALKVVATAHLCDSKAMERLRDEAKSARKITHRNVCKVFDYGEADGLTFLTMQLVEGRNLRAVLRDGPVPKARVFEIVKGLSDGLSAVHLEGMVHRDIKPENVVLRGNGEPVLVDFGLARNIVTGDGQARTMGGTPAYMSPEQVRGYPLDARSDIFALGVLTYELFTGCHPFDRGASTATSEAIKQHSPRSFETPSLSEGMRASVERVLLRAMAKSPSDRFSSAIDFAQGLEQAIQERSGSEFLSEVIPMSNTLPPKGSWSVRRFGRFGLVVLVVLGIGAMLWTRPWINRSSRPARPVVLVVPFRNLTHDATRDGFGSSVTEAVRTALLRLPEIDVRQVSGEKEARASVQANLAHWIVVGSLQGDDKTSLLEVHFESPGREGFMGQSVSVELAPADEDMRVSMDRIKERILDEAWLLVRENERVRRAEMGTSQDLARAYLVEYYHDHYVNIVRGGASHATLDRAKRLLDQAIEADPKYVHAFVERAYFHAKSGTTEQMKEAVIDVDRAIEIDADSAPARIMRCRVLQVALQSDESAADDAAVDRVIQACNAALDVEPSSADVHLVFARLHNLRCNDIEAMKSLHEAREKDRGETGRALAHFVHIALDGEQWDRAEEASSQLVRFEEEQRMGSVPSMIARLGIPPEIDAPLLHAIALLRVGKEAKALEQLEKQHAWLVPGTSDPILEAVTRSMQHRLLNPTADKKSDPVLLRNERQIQDQIGGDLEMAMYAAWYYQWFDPVKAAEWVDLATASNAGKESPSCSVSLRIATLQEAAGDLEKARAAAAKCKPRFDWEKNCLAWVDKRLSR